MRFSSALLLGILATARSVHGQGYPAEMVITSPEVEVRSGPTQQYYATGKLKYGDKVIVLRESEQQKGWLAIKPPPGSFSWIDAKLIKQTDAHTGVVINPGGAHVLVGSAVTGNAPNVSPPFTIPLGSIVSVLDKAKAADGVNWLPIQPWPQEVRFIPGEAVQTRTYANNNAANINGGAAAVSSANPLISQADAAFQSGNVSLAKQLYKDAAEKTGDYAQKTYCYNRLMSLSQPAWNPVQAPGHPTQMAQAGGWSVGQTASLVRPAPQNLVYPAHWSQVGILRRAQFDIGGQPAYYLENKGNLLIYATCQPGTTLRDFVGRTVALFGTTTYCSNEYLRTHVMTASQVATY